MKHLNKAAQQPTLQACEQERLVLDYVNGHLSPSEKNAFEAQLQHDASLHVHVAQTRQWQQAMSQSNAFVPAVTPDFKTIEHKLKRKNTGWLIPAIPVALACALVVTLNHDITSSEPALTPDNYPNQTFETLTQAQSRQSGMLQLTLVSDAHSSSVIKYYDLTVIESFANQRILTIDASALNEQSRTALLEDERIMLIKDLGQTR